MPLVSIAEGATQAQPNQHKDGNDDGDNHDDHEFDVDAAALGSRTLFPRVIQPRLLGVVQDDITVVEGAVVSGVRVVSVRGSH
jgi:hypothetical protein